MFPSLTAAEFNLVQRDFRDMVEALEASTVVFKYRTLLNPAGVPDIDPVYKNDRNLYNDTEVVSGDIPCIVKIVHATNLKTLGFGIVEVGDAIFLFLDTINLKEPVAGKPVIPETLYIVDSLGTEWVPINKDAGPLRHHLGMVLQNQAIAQVVPATLVKR